MSVQKYKIETRLYSIDYAKILAMFLVVFAHLYAPNSAERLYIYSFHMPFFFWVSGMLHKFDGHIQLKKYFRTLIVPYIFFTLLYLLFAPVLYAAGIWDINIDLPDVNGSTLRGTFLMLKASILSPFSGNCYIINGTLWFLLALFWCKLWCDWMLVKNNQKMKVALVILLFVLVLVFHPTHRLFIAQGLMALPFYFMGYMLKPYLQMSFRTWCLLLVVILFLCLNIGITQINGHVSMVSTTFGTSTFPINFVLFYINGILGSAMLLMLVYNIRRATPFIVKCSNAMISILGLQKFGYNTVKHVLGQDNNWLLSCVLAMTIMLICVLLHNLFLRYIPWVFNKRKNI